MKTVNVSLVGVGGQGIILTADLLAKTAAIAGYDVKKSEIHGMAQRGGSVTSQVRFGDSVASPIIQEGTADILVSFDKLEALPKFRLVFRPVIVTHDRRDRDIETEEDGREDKENFSFSH